MTTSAQSIRPTEASAELTAKAEPVDVNAEKPLELAQLFDEAFDFVNPPDDQVAAAHDVVMDQAAALAPGADVSGQLPLPEFTPPAVGMTVTSLATGNSYTIGRVIGEGAFGTVYEASDTWLNELAVKVLKPLGTYEQIQQAATQEFDKLLRLRHTHVTHVIDAFEFKSTFYIVTERCAGPLSELFLMEQLHGPVWVQPVARCILQAVHFLHVSGYVHQDIHFGNCFMHFHKNEMGDDSGRASMSFKLADLGIAKMFNEIDAQNTVLNGSIAPPEFLDPQQFGPLDLRVDIYHCGLLFLQLYMGKQLTFTNDEILQGKPRQLAEQLPAPFGFALSKALRRHVVHRTQSAMELWRDLTMNVAPLLTTPQPEA